MDRRLIAVACVVFSTLSLSGCEQLTTPPTDEVSFTSIAVGTYSGITSERFEVIRGDADLTGLWLEHTANTSPVPDQPAVDFSQNMVIATFLGERSTGGYGITITSVEEQTDSLVAHVKATVPGASCMTTQAFTQPHHIVTLGRSSKVIIFQTSVEQVNCP